LVVGINKPLPCRVVLVGSPPQKGGYLVRNWSVALAEARADRDRARVYLPQPPSILETLVLDAFSMTRLGLRDTKPHIEYFATTLSSDWEQLFKRIALQTQERLVLCYFFLAIEELSYSFHKLRIQYEFCEKKQILHSRMLNEQRCL
jgi:hypothetical protein